jgi:hypothetical protein
MAELRGGPPSSHHPAAVSKSSTHPSEAEQHAPATDNSFNPPREPLPSIEEMQAERQREEKAMEQLLKNVKPIQTDYHLFIEAEKEKHMDGANTDGGDDPYLRNSSLNYRLKAAWENLGSSQRAEFFKKEELDRKRFMEEEEVASRHCATLTARNTTTSVGTGTRKKSPTPTAQVTVDGETTVDTRDEDPNKRMRDDMNDTEGDESSPLKKERLEHILDSAAVETAAAAESVEFHGV